MHVNQEVGSVIPLESNPAIFQEFAVKLGLSPLLSFNDIYSITDQELMAFIARPVYSIILLFPLSLEYETLKNNEDSERDHSATNNVMWFKQVIRNACGLYALLHALCNLPSGLIVSQSKIYNFIENVKHTDNIQAQASLVNNLAQGMYNEFSKQGQTEAPSAEDSTDLHFICFTKGLDGKIYELDGRREGPHLLGNPIEGDVIDQKIVVDRIQKYMSLAKGENSLKFAMMGLSPTI